MEKNKNTKRLLLRYNLELKAGTTNREQAKKNNNKILRVHKTLEGTKIIFKMKIHRTKFTHSTKTDKYECFFGSM